MSQSVLEQPFVVDSRPFSAKELWQKRQKTVKRFHLGNITIDHPRCRHCYLAKAGGRKEQEAKASEGKNLGNCSVCWKMRKTPEHLRPAAAELVDAYINISPDRFDPPASAYHVELERVFYTWLYGEFNPPRPDARPARPRLLPSMSKPTTDEQ